jgi:hypothetical protein
MLFRVIQLLLGGNCVCSSFNKVHFGTFMHLYVHAFLSFGAEFRRAWNEKHLQPSDVVQGMGFFMLDTGAIEKIDMTPFDGAYVVAASVLSEKPGKTLTYLCNIAPPGTVCSLRRSTRLVVNFGLLGYPALGFVVFHWFLRPLSAYLNLGLRFAPFC